MSAPHSDTILSDVASTDTEALHTDQLSIASSLDLVADMLREVIILQIQHRERAERAFADMQQQINNLTAEVHALRAPRARSALR
jgi:hypothetical protein